MMMTGHGRRDIPGNVTTAPGKATLLPGDETVTNIKR
jgi:hypothetical protein